MEKFWVFRELIDFVANHCEVTDADMDNYAGDIEIHGTDDDGSTIKISVRIDNAKEEEENA